MIMKSLLQILKTVLNQKSLFQYSRILLLSTMGNDISLQFEKVQ